MHTSNNALHGLTLIKLTVTCLMGTEGFFYQIF